MAMPRTLKSISYLPHLLLAAILISCATSARLLDEVEPQPTIPSSTTTTTASPSGQIPVTGLVATPDDNAEATPPIPEAEAPAATEAPSPDVEAPESDVPPVPPLTVGTTTPSPTPVVTGSASTTSPDPVPVVAGSASTTSPGPAPVTTGSASITTPAPHEPTLSFFMHDIIGGSHPSARVVTGIIANSEVSGIPFSKPNSNLFPVSGATPLLNGGGVNSMKGINNVVNNPGNLPLLTGLTGAQASTVIQSAGNNNNVQNGQSQPFVTAGQLPAGSLQRLMFGSITVVDDELTETHQLDSAVIGKAQGFYLASSMDGTSHTFAMTVLIHGEHEHGGVEDTISFFGVHRTASVESQVAVVGGTGKYEMARGYATVGTVHKDDHDLTTDGMDTVIQVNVYLTPAH